MVWTITILYVAALALILAEFFVPGGILGVIGGILLLTSGGMTIYHYPEHALLAVFGQFAGVVVLILGALVILPRFPGAQFLVLRDTMDTGEGGWVSDPSDTTLVGRIGEVHSMLRPAGIVEIDGERINAVSDGSFIEPGEKVRVMEVHGNRIVVEKVDNE